MDEPNDLITLYSTFSIPEFYPPASTHPSNPKSLIKFLDENLNSGTP
jgi:hypothetical protein